MAGNADGVLPYCHAQEVKTDSGTAQKRNIVKLPVAWYCGLFNP